MKTNSGTHRKSFYGILMFVFLAVFVSCSKDSAAQAETEMRDGKPVLSMYMQSATTTPDKSEIDLELQELTGVITDKTFLVADQATTSGILLASGDYADILNMREDTAKFVDAGVFIPLQDLIKQHAPNIYRLYKPYWDQIKHRDGNIYTIPEIYPLNPQVRTAGSGPGVGLYIQKAVLEWAGYPQIGSTADYFALLKSYKAAFPQIGGQQTIGFAFPAEGWRFGFTIYSSAYLYGYPNESGPLIDCMVGGKVDNSDKPCAGQWRPRDTFYQSESFHNVMQQYNQAYLDGLIPKETIVQTHDQYNEKIASGRVLGVFDQGWEFSGAQEVLKVEQPERMLYNLPIAYEPDIQLFVGTGTPNYGAGFGISVKAQDPVAAIQYLDQTLSKEAILLQNWGIEGTDYMVDSAGRYYRTEEQRIRAKDKAYKDRHWGSALLWVVQGSFDDGNAVIPDTQPDEYFALLSKGDREVAAAYDVKSLAELFAAPSDRRLAFSPLWTFQFDKEKDKDYLKIAGQRDDLTREYTAKLIFAEAGQFDTVWQEYNDKLAAIPNAQFWLETWKQRLQERIDSWK